MPPESWLVLTVAAAFLLLAIAVSPLAWALLDQPTVAVGTDSWNTDWRKLADQVRDWKSAASSNSSRSSRADVADRGAEARPVCRGRARLRPSRSPPTSQR